MTEKKTHDKRTNKTMIQAFTWFMPDDGSLWKRIAEMAPDLKECGINMVWLPPAYKAASTYNSAGYDVYDRYDLGEFDQKGKVRTRYGTKQEYLNCITALHRNNMKAIADIVLNQMCEADESEKVKAVTYHQNDRLHPIFGGQVKEIVAYTKYTFPGRKAALAAKNNNRSGSASAVEEWDYHDFNSVDYDQNNHDYDSRDDLKPEQKNCYLFDGKKFSDDVSHENGNYDYLLGCNIDYDPVTGAAAREKTINWGKWYLKTTGVDGFRLDAVKHISQSFMLDWVRSMQETYAETHSRKKLFIVGEYLKGEQAVMLDYPENEEGEADFCRLFDFPLQAKMKNEDRRLFSGSLTSDNPEIAVSLVNNHDMDPHQGYRGVRIDDDPYSWSRREKAYAWILFQEKSLPCIYMGDLVGYKYPEGDQLKWRVPYENFTGTMNRYEQLLKLCWIRYECAYGKTDQIEEGDVRGYVRMGLPSMPESGLVILLSFGYGATVTRRVARRKEKETMINIFSPNGGMDAVELGPDGWGSFTVTDGGLGVWIPKTAYEKLEKHPAFTNAYDWMK